MEDNTDTNPKSRQLALRALGDHPGWAVYCKRFQDIIGSQIDARIFDVNTSDEQCRNLRHARKLLQDAYTPEKLRGAMLAQADTEVLRAAR